MRHLTFLVKIIIRVGLKSGLTNISPNLRERLESPSHPNPHAPPLVQAPPSRFTFIRECDPPAIPQF
jgi:hypothetical protein